MLQFNEIKNELLRERARLEIIIKNQKEILEILKPMDGKMYNKKITDFVEKNDKFRAYISDATYSEKALTISLKNLDSMLPKLENYRSHSYYENWIFEARKNRITDENEKRFSYEKFREVMLEKIQHNQEELAAINGDLAEGESRLAEMGKVLGYYKELAKTFSHYVRGNYSGKFEVGYIG